MKQQIAEKFDERFSQRKEITLLEAIELINSAETKKFDVHHGFLQPNGDALTNGIRYYVKGNVYYSDEVEINPELTIREFMNKAREYTLFFLSIWSGVDNEEYTMLEIIDEDKIKNCMPENKNDPF